MAEVMRARFLSISNWEPSFQLRYYATGPKTEEQRASDTLSHWGSEDHHHCISHQLRCILWPDVFFYLLPAFVSNLKTHKWGRVQESLLDLLIGFFFFHFFNFIFNASCIWKGALSIGRSVQLVTLLFGGPGNYIHIKSRWVDEAMPPDY